MRISDYRLSHAMKDVLVALSTGTLKRGDNNFPAVTAWALYRRGLVEESFSPTKAGQEIAEELISRQSKTFQRKTFSEPELERLILGLRVFQQCAPSSTTYPTNRCHRSIAIKDEAFGSMNDEQRNTLQNLGWEQTDNFEWVF